MRSGRFPAVAFVCLAAVGVAAACRVAKSTPQALVVYNANHPDGAAIAEYYAEARGIPAAQICPVELPVGQFASKDQLLAARRTILEDCICALIPPELRPQPCATSNVDAVRARSKITHLALVKGIPPRLYGTPWPSDSEEPSFDFYLAYLVYRSDDVFAPGSSGSYTTSYLTSQLIDQANALWILSAPPLDPVLHRDLAYGRIEAIDRERTFALVDRTLDAERRGVTGSFLEERSPSNKNFRFLRELTGSLDPACTAYVTHEPFLFDTPESSWPAGTCRAGTTFVTAKGPDPGSTTDDPVSQVVPGSAMSTVPRAVGVGLLLGSVPWPNDQAGFNAFDVLVNWRRTSAPCTALCEDLPTQAERDACAAQSADWFRELDTTCVGAARGFLGHQVRSYPVQYYGFFPPGWLTDLYGDVEKTPPRVLEGGAWQDARFTDDRYLHLGERGVDDPGAPTCTREDGGSEPCPERIAVDLMAPQGFVTPFPLAAPREFVLRFRHRNAASPGGSLGVSLRFFDGTASAVASASVPLDQANPDWVTAERSFTIAPGTLSQVSQINAGFSAGLADGLVCCLDLDGVEIVDVETGESVLDVELGSFSSQAHQQTHPGDWAANAIDRLGAVAWWGSSSHHLSGGWSFSKNERFYGAFFMGRTLGESLALTTGEAGIVYGDPLYRPVAVRIHLPGLGGYGAAPGLAVHPGNVAGAGTVLLNVLHGTANVNLTRWELASCPILDPAQCGDAGLWTQRASGTGALAEHPVAWTGFIDPTVAQDLLLRLRVWNPGEEADELFNYAYLSWSPQ
jgi:hypothetical protein